MLKWCMIFLVGVGSAGCAHDAQHQSASNNVVKNATADELRIVAMNFADEYVLTMGQAFDELIQRSSRAEVTDWARDQKISTATAAFTNATTSNPATSFVDLLILVTLKRIAIEKHWMPIVLHDEGESVLAAARKSEADAWEIASRILTERQVADLHVAIDEWVANHPDQYYVGWVRLAEISTARSWSTRNSQMRAPNSLLGLLFLDPLAGLDPVAQEMHQFRLLSERLTYLAMRMPGIYGWKLEQSIDRMTNRGAARDLADATARFSEAAEQFSTTAATYPEAFSDALHTSLEKADAIMAGQRTVMLEQLSTQLNEQRDALFDDIDRRQQKLDDSIIKTRDALTDAQLAAKEISISTQQAITSARNALLWVILAATILPLLAMLIYRKSQRRSDH